ncbi:hypothetical protein, conserved [Thermococcus kodakarensis KOD1]|uniref:Uncharacterized protein n=1 Tax=Thermococcus kodakarensis (strain ATCC BAA-918 / JCM 12380 / KOD1) TaxID=69014 RepID=Q5JFC2_THEKO|nr:hypothetical protein [Thermococcus kodakarensis]WCN28639.1 hypothetical protein POG15_03040 [Thermococcus kodakarensis]WCN30937.1 hypothetical protein POG21_03040 [Thermococcus kodakarensis]BAD84781.1 hypothetical protein, conserved [Thermococcus kodakarensis KOD1]
MASGLDKYLKLSKYEGTPIRTLEELSKFQKAHTKLMNIILNLATPTPKFPNDLYKKGYRIVQNSIEAHIHFRNVEKEDLNGKGVTPDIILPNYEKEHIVVFECKSFQANHEQLQKYLYLIEHPEIIIDQARIPFKKRPTQLKADVSYFSYKDIDNNETLSNETRIQIIRIIEINPPDKSEDPTNPVVKEIELVKGEYKNPELNQVFPIKWRLKDKPSYVLFPFDPNDDAEIFQIHIINKLIEFATLGQELPTKGMVFKDDIIIPKGKIIKKSELPIDDPNEQDQKWEQLLNTLEKIAPGKYEVEEDEIRISEDILLLKAGKALDEMRAELIMLIDLEVDMNTLTEREFTTGELAHELYTSSAYSIYQFLHGEYRDLIKKRVNDSLKRLSTGPLKGYLKRNHRHKHAWRIKIIDKKQIPMFRETCGKAVRELESKFKTKYIDEYIKIFLTPKTTPKDKRS